MKNLHRNENSIIFQNQYFDPESGQLLSPLETQNYVIVQVADSYYKNAFVIEHHLQPCDLEITLPLAGELFCSSNQTSAKVENGTSFLSFRGEYHRLNSSRNSHFQTLAVNFKDGPCRPMLTEILGRYRENPCFRIPELASLMAAVVAEFLSPDTPFGILHLDSLITSICVRLIRCDRKQPELNLLSTEESLPAILNYIDTHFLELLSLEELSSRFGYTYSHICKVFKKTYGMTPGNHLRAKKMEHASVLLKKGKNLSEIAELLGYSTPYNFSRAFKEVYGVSPGKYHQFH